MIKNLEMGRSSWITRVGPSNREGEEQRGLADGGDQVPRSGGGLWDLGKAHIPKWRTWALSLEPPDRTSPADSHRNRLRLLTCRNVR